MRVFSRRLLYLIAASLSLLDAQGTKTRDAATKYSAHAEVASVSVGADFWGHYIPLEGSSVKTDGYLVVEIALFPQPKAKVAVIADQFELIVNGQRLMPVSQGQVVLGLVMPEMRETGTRLEAEAGAGPVVVSTGKDPAQPRFPGDSNPAGNPQPPLNRSPEVQEKDPLNLEKAVANLALPEGSHAAPVSGYLFYAWPGKLKRIKHAEIEYSSPLGAAKLLLR